MKTRYEAIQKEIESLCGPSILVSLLLLRHLSQDSFLPLALPSDGAKRIGRHLWERILANQGGNSMASIAESLTLVEPIFPFASKLIEQNERESVKESALKRLIYLLSEIPIDDLSCAAIYERYLRKKTAFYQAAPSFGGFYTPQGIAQCLAAFLSPDQGAAYDPCCGSGAFLLAVQKCGRQTLKLYGQAQNEESYLVSQINFILHGIYDVDLGETAISALADDQHIGKKFDSIIANPPFNLENWFDGNFPFWDDRWRLGDPPRSNANFAWLQHILSHLQPNGRAAVILPNGTLTTQTRREAAIRKAMVQNRLIEAVIALPPGLFYSAKIPFCIWLLTNGGNKNGDILFVDAGYRRPEIKKEPVHIERLQELVNKYRQGKLHACTEWYATASLEKMEQKGFLLSPNLYTVHLRPSKDEIQRGYSRLLEIIEELSMLPIDRALLSSIIQWKNAEMEKNWKKADLLELYEAFGGVTKGKEFFGKGTPAVDVKAVIHSLYLPDRLSLYVDVTESKKIKYGIKRGDVFLNRTSETIRELACCSVALQDQKAVYSGFIKRLRPRCGQTINPLYAACYFRSEIYRWEVEDVSTVYTTYASIDNKKLSRIAVYFPGLETQEKIGAAVFESFQFRKRCSDELQRKRLEEFERLLIQQYITYPVLCAQNKEGGYPCG